MMAYLYVLSIQTHMTSQRFEFSVFMIILRGAVPILVRMVNSKYLLRISKSMKIGIIVVLELLSWLIVIKAFIGSNGTRS